MSMGNGSILDEGAAQHEHLRGLFHVDMAVPSLQQAALALEDAARKLASIARGVHELSAGTARALSDATAMKRTLANLTAREQELRAQVVALRKQARPAAGASSQRKAGLASAKARRAKAAKARRKR